MNAAAPDWTDLAIAAGLLIAEAVASLLLGLGLARAALISAARMTVQLLLVGLVLRWVFATGSAGVTAALVLLMLLVAAREIATRPTQRLCGSGNYAVAAMAAAAGTGAAAIALAFTSLRPTPPWEPRTVIPLAGILLGAALNAGSLALDSVLGGALAGRAAIEARLALGVPWREATRDLLRDATRRGIVPALNQMAAAGIITLPGIMTGQILAGADPESAVRWQVALLLLLGAASGLTAYAAAALALRRLTDDRERLRLDRLA
ncbi:MAG: ABC transporter permease [Acetobacteraceae bacterium]|nr:ABC transporter permease [Acetobacteraceae bacterium]